MIHSGAGDIVVEEWLKTEELRTYVKLDQFVMMPNHFHGILLIEGRKRARHAVPLQSNDLDNRCPTRCQPLLAHLNLP